MKQIFFILLYIISSYGYELNFAKDFNQNLKPDILHTYISIEYNSKDETVVNDTIEQFNLFFKENNNITKKNGSFTLNPIYRYINNEQQFLTYKGRLSYTIEDKSPKKLTTFITELIEFKKENFNNAKLSIGTLQWSVSKKIKDKTIDNLRKIAINWIEEYKQTISETCLIKEITISNFNSRNHPYMLKVSSANISPSANKKTIKLTAHYKLDCK